MQPTLGGGQTLRSERDYRFRDTHMLLMNAEYRWEAFSALDMALFTDWGKVAPKFSDLDFSDLEHAYGIGFRVIAAQNVIFRLDIAHRRQRRHPLHVQVQQGLLIDADPAVIASRRFESAALVVAWPARGGLAAIRSAAPLRRASIRTIRSRDDPESQDASNVQALEGQRPVRSRRELVPRRRASETDVRAGNVNTIDEVPDSSWFTNRAGKGSGPLDLERSSRARTRRMARRRPVDRDRAQKRGRHARDSRFATAPARSTGSSSTRKAIAEMASGAEVISTKFFHAFGYHVAENYLATFRPEDLRGAGRHHEGRGRPRAAR